MVGNIIYIYIKTYICLGLAITLPVWILPYIYVKVRQKMLARQCKPLYTV